MDQNEFIRGMREHMQAHGVEPPEELHADGERYYFSTHPSKSYKRSGWYKIYWDSRPTGVYGCFRQDIYEIYTTNPTEPLDPQRAREATELAKEQKRKRKREILHRQQKASVKCQQFWESKALINEVPASHNYLQSKQIGAFRIRYYPKGDRLVIPIRDTEGRIRSRQTISGDGTKMFAPGAPIHGHYFSIGAPTPDGRLYICEGYATGASIAFATRLPVVMAFSDWNLEPVAKAMRKKWGAGLEIVICADNDTETPGNPGVTAATKAAIACRGYVATPHELEEGKKVDWNDVWCSLRSGFLHRETRKPKTKDVRRTLIEKARDEFTKWLEIATAAPNSQAITPELIEGTAVRVKNEEERTRDDPNAWKSTLIMDNKGMIKPVEANVSILLQHDPELKDLFKFNVFSNQIMMVRSPPWVSSTGQYPAQMVDKDRTSLLMYMQRRGIMFTRRHIDESMKSISEHSTFDPLKDMLESLVWDESPRIDTWLIDYCGAPDNEYVRAISRKFLIGAVSRALNPGSKMDTTLVIEGKQGTGKSTLVRLLAMNPEFASDAFPNLKSDRYPEMKLRGVWLMEVPELTGISKADVNAIKDFLARHEDRTRDPYSPVIEHRPRRTVFIATTNQSEYLRDPTGARRFWPVHTGKIKMEALKKVVPQFWAEAVQAYYAGEPWYLEGTVNKSQIDATTDRQIHDPLETMIESYTREKHVNCISPAEVIYEVMAGRDSVKAASFSPHDRARVSAALLNMGWTKIARSRWGKSEVGVRVDLWAPQEIFDNRAFQDQEQMSVPELRKLKLNPAYYRLPHEDLIDDQ